LVDGEHVDDRLVETGLGGRLLGDRSVLRGSGHTGTGRGDLLEDALLVLGVALDRVDEIGDQVGTTGQLDVDPAQRLIDADVLRAELVEADHEERDQHDDDGQDDQDDQHAFPPRVVGFSMERLTRTRHRHRRSRRLR
jgi:hypothetical protein